MNGFAPKTPPNLLENNRRYQQRLKQRALAALGFLFLPDCCPKCGEKSDQLEFAHQQPTPVSGQNGRGQHHRLRDVIKHPECYALRCRKCNAKEPKYVKEEFDDEVPF